MFSIREILARADTATGFFIPGELRIKAFDEIHQQAGLPFYPIVASTFLEQSASGRIGSAGIYALPWLTCDKNSYFIDIRHLTHDRR